MILSILIPVFNEEDTIEKLLKKVLGVKLTGGMSKEIIIIDDGSTDFSIKKIKNQIKKNNVIKLVRHNKNLGKGAAISSGIKHATGDYIIIQDADLEYNPADYLKLLEPLLKNKTSVIYGTRLKNYPFRLWGKNKTVMPAHLLANRFLTTLTNFLYGSNLTDMETCYKLFKRDVLKKISLKSNRFDFEPEVTAKILKLKIPIMEIPVKVKPRTYKEGKKIKWTDGIIAIWTLFKYRFID